MMRKSIGLVALLMVAMAFFVVPAAAESVVATEVSIQGCGYAPILKCKWEQSCDDGGIVLEDGDVDHTRYVPCYPSNSQFIPECGESTTICLVAVAADYDGLDDILNGKVLYKVTSPCGEVIAEGCMPQSEYGTIENVNEADAAHLITYADGYDLTEVQYELGACEPEAGIFKTDVEIGYCYPAGEYLVEIWALDTTGQLSNVLTNYFTMERVAGCQYDFDCMSWDNLARGDHDVLSGDENMLTTDRPTVKNLGNVDIDIWVKQDALKNAAGDEFILNCDDEWYYQYDASFLNEGQPIFFYPGEDYMKLDGFVERCDLDGLCFSIEILQTMPAGLYTGMAYVDCTDAMRDPCSHNLLTVA